MRVENAIQAFGPPPPLHPECAAFLETLPSIPQLTPAMLVQFREHRNYTESEVTRGGTYATTVVQAPGRERDQPVTLLVSAPIAVLEPLPVIYTIHGGGLVMGEAAAGVVFGHLLAGDRHAVVVSPEYRLAPEHPYPAALDDCVAGLVWAQAHSIEFGGDTSRFVLVGESAGGGLAAATSLVARDERLSEPCGVMLLCPMLDDRNNSYSAFQMANHGIWRQADNAFGWQAYLGSAAGGPNVTPYAAPARAKDLARLPPMFLDVATNETFRDETVQFASRIWESGGVAELHVWPGGFHGHSSLVPGSNLAEREWAVRQAWMAQILEGTSPTSAKAL